MTEHDPALAARDELEEWVVATAARAVAYAASLLRDASLAEDVVQDCYCRLLQKASDYNLPRDGVRLLFKAVTNACINLTTRQRPALSLSARAAGEGPRWEVADRTAVQPERALMYQELQDAVEQGLGLLPITQRAALELKSLGHTQQEIAEILSVSVSNAGVLVHRARQTMATYLAPFVQETVE
ncbi:MAG: RNA polymerase sigma factor [Gemmataceae bacterium]|nr:RNA polymerase sigma factor [Gemmataceae bacterium]